MTWLLCDYGEVLSLPQPPEAVAAMAALARMDVDHFQERYWQPRQDYDRGDLTAQAYWTAALGEPPGDRLPALVEADVSGWLHPNPPSVAAFRRAAARGLRLAILSNAPREVAVAIDALPWLSSVSPRLFSYQLRSAKPEPEIFRLAQERLGAAPEDIVFVDDRPANVAAARDFGMTAEVFTNPAQFDALGA